MTPLINGINYAWANITMIIAGVPVIGITKISYKRKQAKDNNYGAGTEPVSRGYGNTEYEASIDLYVDELRRIINSAPERNPLKIPPFDIPVVFSGDGVTYTKDILRAVEFTEDAVEASQGDTKIVVSVPLIIGGIDK